MPDTLLANVFVNLARLDWRRSDGDPANSRLLDTLWHSLDTVADELDPRLGAVKAVAMYQPRQALIFAGRLIRHGRRVSALSEILRTVAYANGDYFNDACRLLWDIGRTDTRELGPHPAYPLRTLTEFGEYQSRKPLGFSQQLLDFALGLMADPRNWDAAYTPLDLLKPLMKGDGEDSKSDGRSINFMPFFVRYEVVQPLRAKIIDTVLELLHYPRLPVAREAATFIGNLLRTPHGRFGLELPEGLYETCAAEFEATLQRILAIVREGLPPVAAFAVARAVSWHARQNRGRCREIAQAILAAMPTNLEFRLIASLAVGFGQIFVEREDVNRWESDLQAWLKAIVAALRAAYSEPESRRAAVEAAMTTLKEARESLSVPRTLCGGGPRVG